MASISNMLVKLCTINYDIYDDVVNGTNGILQHVVNSSPHLLIWIHFENENIYFNARIINKTIISNHLHIKHNWIPNTLITKEIQLGNNYFHVYKPNGHYQHYN
jgi:hypothetical protein